MNLSARSLRGLPVNIGSCSSLAVAIISLEFESVNTHCTECLDSFKWFSTLNPRPPLTNNAKFIDSSIWNKLIHL